jgi:hypothetical protein
MVEIKLATWNVGTLTGRSNELSQILKKRKINICCIQETKWKGSKARNIGNGYKLIYHGQDTRRNGVGIVLDEHMQERIVNVERKSDRLMAVKLALDDQPCMNVITEYAPQVGCSSAEKQSFWEDFDDLIQAIPNNESRYIGADLNGHVGETTETYKNIHGGYGYGSKNSQGDDILQFASTYNMALVNTYFKKLERHLITYCSGEIQSQIDYILTDRQNIKNSKNCKVILGEPLTAQHRLLVAKFNLPRKLNLRKEKIARIRWHKLSRQEGIECCAKIKQHMNVGEDMTADDAWKSFQHGCIEEAEKCLGISKGPISNDRETHWWNDEVKAELANKKALFKKWQGTKTEEDKLLYKAAKQTAKRTVAQAKASANQTSMTNLKMQNMTQIYSE